MKSMFAILSLMLFLNVGCSLFNKDCSSCQRKCSGENCAKECKGNCDRKHKDCKECNKKCDDCDDKEKCDRKNKKK